MFQYVTHVRYIYFCQKTEIYGKFIVFLLLKIWQMMDKLTPEQRKRNMRANKASGTSIEIILGKLMWASGLRYRKNCKTVIGKPDFVFKSKRIAIFCDGEFWHGKDWEVRKSDHKTNKKFWFAKIERNIERDKEVNKALEQDGWTVIRFWGDDIKNNPNKCIETIKTVYGDATHK